MGGQIGPVPLKKGKRKAPAGGVRQRVEHLGGLRCIVAEKDEGSEEVPKCVVILAHGIHVLADDLCALARAESTRVPRAAAVQSPHSCGVAAAQSPACRAARCGALWR
jgi:hypothetical protein